MFKQNKHEKTTKPQTGTWASRLCALCQTPPRLGYPPRWRQLPFLFTDCSDFCEKSRGLGT